MFRRSNTSVYTIRCILHQWLEKVIPPIRDGKPLAHMPNLVCKQVINGSLNLRIWHKFSSLILWSSLFWHGLSDQEAWNLRIGPHAKGFPTLPYVNKALFQVDITVSLLLPLLNTILQRWQIFCINKLSLYMFIYVLGTLR